MIRAKDGFGNLIVLLLFTADQNRPFNNFEVFGEKSHYSTFRFHYENYHFDQLRELMYYNVSSHIEASG